MYWGTFWYEPPGGDGGERGTRGDRCPPSGSSLYLACSHMSDPTSPPPTCRPSHMGTDPRRAHCSLSLGRQVWLWRSFPFPESNPSSVTARLVAPLKPLDLPQPQCPDLYKGDNYGNYCASLFPVLRPEVLLFLPAALPARSAEMGPLGSLQEG